jgi:predicted RNA-binding Zn ribbon-like protein
MPDAAPGSLHLVQSFASTLSAEPDADLLRTREEAAAWLRAAGLLPADAGLTNSEHAALLRLRDAVRDALAAHSASREDPAAAARLTKALAEGRLVVAVDPASTVRLASAARASYPSVVAAVAVAVAESAAAGTWLHLRSCPAPGCGRPFYDDSGRSACSAHAAG